MPVILYRLTYITYITFIGDFSLLSFDHRSVILITSRIYGHIL